MDTSLCLSFSVYKIKTTVQTQKDAEGTNEMPKIRRKMFTWIHVCDYKLSNVYSFYLTGE